MAMLFVAVDFWGAFYYLSSCFTMTSYSVCWYSMSYLSLAYSSASNLPCTAWCDFLTRNLRCLATSDLLWFGGSVLVGCWWCLPKCPRCTAADSGLLLLTQCTAAPACLTKLLACYIAGLLYSTIDVDIFINTCLVRVLTRKVVASDYICLF